MTTALNHMSSESLNEAQAANFLNLSIRTLQAWRVRGGGPVFCRLGRCVRYRQRDLEAFLGARVCASTSQEGR